MKFKILIETSTNRCLLALLDQQEVIRSVYCSSEQLKHRFLSLVEDLLQNITFDLIEGIACSAGPGSFTGIRIGLAFAKGLAFAAHVPLVTFSSLVGFVSEEEGEFISVIDAKSKGFYCLQQEKYQESVSYATPQMMTKQELAALKEEITVVGPCFPVQGLSGIEMDPNPKYLAKYLLQADPRARTFYLSSPFGSELGE